MGLEIIKKEEETEEVELIKIYKKNGLVHVRLTDDANEYEVYGIMKTYLDALKNKLTDGWEKE